MKPTIDPAAVSAIATAAFLAHNPTYREEANMLHPERILEEPFGLEALIRNQSSEISDAAVLAYDRALAFGLQVGARIGADPLHVPDIKDLVAAYRIKPKMKVA